MMTSHNPLNSLPNRLVLNGTLKQAIDARSSIAVALLDIDSFMEINADFGQAVGDRVLHVLAALLKEAAPTSVYHLSSDEFALVLPGLSLGQAYLRIEAVRADLDSSA